MPKMKPSIDEKAGIFYLAVDDAAPKAVMRISTASRDYIVSPHGVGDAIRTGTPMLRVTSAGADHSNQANITAAILEGVVYGHPERADGTPMKTSGIREIHFVDGSKIQTELGRLMTEGLDRSGQALGSGMAKGLIAAAHGRTP